ncbi:MAG: tRNA (adenosine(37)-N6)-threonylcarbamoyltransferase complex ATPase subunit type 1 TsaE [Traorella sp.]
MKINIKSKKETQEFGEKLGMLCTSGTCITLNGDLGAGKTTLTKSIGKALGINKTISSPTFTILKIYQGNLPLYHIDAYRLEGINQDLGFEEMLEGDGVCVVEWGEFIEDILPKERLDITILNGNEEERVFEVKAFGIKYEKIMEKLK